MVRAWSAGLLFLLLACSRGTGVAPPHAPRVDAAPICQDACGDNDGGRVASIGDPIEYVSVAEDNFGGFFEPVEVQVWGDRVVACTGVQGLAIYRAADACCLSLEASVRFSAGSARYPRCQHMARVGDRVALAHRGDEIQPGPFLTVVDLSNVDRPRTLSTFNDGSSFEGLAVRGDLLYAAMHGEGLGVFRLASDGELSEVFRTRDGIENAWQPLLDAGGQLLYLADAVRGLTIFSLADPERPVLIGHVASLGTLKELVQRSDILYGAAGTAGVEVFDVSTPAAPALLRRLDTPGSALGVDANQTHLVVADWNAVQLYELTDPRAPRHLGHQKAQGRAGPTASGRILDVALRGQDVFMAEWTGIQAHRIAPDVEGPDLWAASIVEAERTAPGQHSDIAMTVENLGTTALEIADIAVSAPFAVTPDSLTVPAGRRELVTIRFSPDSDEPARSTLTMTSNDPDQPIVEVAVQGNLEGLRAGDQVPNLVFDTLDGLTVDLDAQRGGPVLLAYFATF